MIKVLKNKIFIISSAIVISIITLFFLFYLILNLSLKLNGNSQVYINYNEEYKEQGATLKILKFDLSNMVKTIGKVENGKIGNYTIKYKAKLLFLNIIKKRVVKVVDNMSPIITLEGENKVNICPNKDYEEEGYKAIDDYDGDITDKVKVNILDNQITYEVSDTFGNKEEVIRELLREDTLPPAIKLKGSQTMYIRKGSQYIEYGYEVADNCDDEVNVTVTGSVDTNTDGKYILEYIATDSSGNEAQIKRTVEVYTDNRIGIVYLTFDDGPSATGSTEKILNVLKQEGVKATFFVTGSGPDSLIKREYDEGHVIALHTNTHNYYTLYKSVDAYYEDLNAVKNRVYNITGQNANIIRFPGGSNNTVSITASGYVIMDTLTKSVVDNGYYYFDWNVSGADAGSCTTSSCVYNSVINGLSKSRINIVLMHDIKMYTANAIEDIIHYCKNNGYVFDVITESTPKVRFK